MKLAPDLDIDWVPDLVADLVPDLIPDLVPDLVIDLVFDLVSDLVADWIVDLIQNFIHRIPSLHCQFSTEISNRYWSCIQIWASMSIQIWSSTWW